MARFPSLTPFVTLGRLGRTTNKASTLDYAFNFVPVSQRVCFVVKVALTSFILICRSFFRVNFLYSKVVFHLIFVNFQHPNFMER